MGYSVKVWDLPTRLFHWILVTDDEGPPLFVNTNNVLITGGSIDSHHRPYLTTRRQEHATPIGVYRGG